jgi:tetratricopeptide (TPR) repeat protein
MNRLLFRNIGSISVGFLLIIIFGCATPPPKPPSIIPQEPKMPAPLIKKDPFLILAEEYRNKAKEYEKSEDLYKALQSWQIVAKFIPNDEDLAKKITELKSQTQTKADEHFTKGLFHYQKHSVQEAQREFLLTLSYNPDHKEALNYLKNKLSGEAYKLYEVKNGDTLKEVARKTYEDPQKDFLIAYFNDLRMHAKLVPGSTLKLPILELTPAKSTMDTKEGAIDVREIPIDTKEMLSKALTYYKVKNYRDTLSTCERILEYDPTNREARSLIDESHYQIGKLFIQGKKYEEALEILNRVDAGYKDVSKSIAFAKKQLAEEHYISGVKYYTEEELEKAIKEWEATLALDSNHPKAKKDIENARGLLQKLKEIK